MSKLDDSGEVKYTQKMYCPLFSCNSFVDGQGVLQMRLKKEKKLKSIFKIVYFECAMAPIGRLAFVVCDPWAILLSTTDSKDNGINRAVKLVTCK